MIEKVMTWLQGFGFTPKIAKIVLIAGAAVVIFVGCVTGKVLYDHRIISHAIDKANVEILQKQAPANDTAADARASDTIQLHEKARERTDAIAKETDQPPSSADLALNCYRLREAGVDTSNLPACSRR